MKIDKDRIRTMFLCAGDAVIAAEQELTEIDSRFGDADHGITMTKIAGAVRTAAQESTDDSIKSMLDDIAMGVMMINGGSAVPLWNTFLDAMQENAPDAGEITLEQLKEMFGAAAEELSVLSKAKVGDKTMMDAILPAVAAIQETEGDLSAVMNAGAQAALTGAEATKNYVSKFGRAKSYKEETIGTPDAGAVSAARFFVGLSQGTTG